MKINPAHLIQFATVVAEGSITRAAARLNLTQPALSRNIKLLEERIGGALLVREKSGAEATELGRLICGYGQSMHALYGHVTELASSHSLGQSGILRIGATPYMTDSLISEPLIQFLKLYPNLTYRLARNNFESLMEELLSGGLDLALCPLAFPEKNNLIRFERLVDDRLEVFSNPQHPLAQLKTVSPKKLRKAKWIGHPINSLLKQQMDTQLTQLGVSDALMPVQTDSRKVVLDLLKNTEMISLLPRLYFAKELDADELTVLAVPGNALERPLGMAYHTKTPLSKATRNFAEHLRQWLW